MATQYSCKNEDRRTAVRTATGSDGLPVLNGIDYIEVATIDQKTLKVHFIHDLPGEPLGVPASPAPALTEDNVLIEGGARIAGIRVRSAGASGNILTVTVDEPGDFSIYSLRLVQSPSNLDAPTGFDPQLAEIGFSFKVDCPSDFDCKTDTACPAQSFDEPEINYLAKDYATLRRLALDRLSVIMPDWKERSAADLQVALVELLAYVGDYLSYYQDAVATEAYLGTARKRISVRRHARLLDYFMHEGCNARIWVALEVEEGGGADGVTLPRGTPLLTKGATEGVVVTPGEMEAVLEAEKAEVFETMHEVTLRASHNKIRFHIWSDGDCCLPKGSTKATLLDTLDASLNRRLALTAGDLLLFEEVVSPTTGLAPDADPARRHVVRLTGADNSRSDPLDGTPVVEIEWSDEDALPFPLCLSSSATDEDVSVARANVVLADHGLSIRDEPLEPDEVPEKGLYRPRLEQGPLSFIGPFDPVGPASGNMSFDVHDARPSIALSGDGKSWAAVYDLLSSDEFSSDFVVEMESDGIAHLRFGDGVLGSQPSAGAAFTATYRIGNGTQGNVGADAIARIVWSGSGITKVRNPLAAKGGEDPESLEEVRQFAPHAFRKQERAVTEADYAEIAERDEAVQQAAATFRWTGSWYTAFVTVDRKSGSEVTEEFEDAMRSHLERFRMAGYDVEINAPIYVPLNISLSVCVKTGYFQSDVKESLLEAFSSRDLPNGKRGFFHPDNFTFGQPVYLSQIYEAAMNAAGVASVEVIRFQRWGEEADQEIEEGVLRTDKLEIVQLANDPNYPENGKMDLDLRGGL